MKTKKEKIELDDMELKLVALVRQLGNEEITLEEYESKRQSILNNFVDK